MAAAGSADLGLITKRNSLTNRSNPPHIMPFNVPLASDNVRPATASPGTASPGTASPGTASPVTASGSSERLKKLLKRYRFVKFGIEIFDLNVKTNKVTSGAPKLLSLDDFYERFGKDEEINNVIQYWNITQLFDSATSISEPKPLKFRFPCYKPHIDSLKKAFTQYRDFIQAKVALYRESESIERTVLEEQLVHILNYLAALDQGAKPTECLAINDPDSQDPSDYYSVLPKVFHQLYMKARAGNELDVKELFRSYPALSSATREYLLNKTTYDEIPADNEGITEVVQSVVDLFKMIHDEFPELYKDITNKVKPPSDLGLEDFTTRVTAAVNGMTHIQEEDRKKIIKLFIDAHNAYGIDDFSLATGIIEEIIKLIAGLLEGVTAKINGLTDGYIALEQNRISALLDKAELSDDILKNVTSKIDTLKNNIGEANVEKLTKNEEELNEVIKKTIDELEAWRRTFSRWR